MEDVKERILAERLARLERRLENYDRMIEQLRKFAQLSPTGRVIVKALGL